MESFLKKFVKSENKEVKVADHTNPHVLQVIRVLKKTREDRQTHELKLLEEEIEHLSFL